MLFRSAGDDTLTQAALRGFEIVLLRETGLLPQLDQVTSNGVPVGPLRPYQLRPELGVLPFAHGDAPLRGDTLLRLEEALAEGDLRALQMACADALPPLKITLRQWLHYHLGASRLRTRQVMLASQQLAEPPVPPEESVE